MAELLGIIGLRLGRQRAKYLSCGAIAPCLPCIAWEVATQPGWCAQLSASSIFFMPAMSEDARRYAVPGAVDNRMGLIRGGQDNRVDVMPLAPSC